MKRKFKKLPALIAAIAVCSCTSVAVLASNGKLEGFFEDIKRWDGAVTGTRYNQADDEIDVTAKTDENELRVSARIITLDSPPYFGLDEYSIKSYRILDKDSKVVKKGEVAEKKAPDKDEVQFRIDISELESGSYTLEISSFIGYKKADQPLDINGTWKCSFEY